MAGPDSALGGDASQDPTTAPSAGLAIEGESPDDADIDIVAVHGLHRSSVTHRWKEGNDEKTSIRKAFEGWTGKKVRLMTYNYPPTTVTPWRIHQEASSLLDALQDLRTRDDTTTAVSEDTGGKEPERDDPEQGSPDQAIPEQSNTEQGDAEPGASEKAGAEQGSPEQVDSEKVGPYKKALRPIIFLSQDVGGLIVKAALTRATSLHRPFTEIAASVRGLIFVACPHRHDGPRRLEDQLLGILHGQVPAHLSVSAQARNLAHATEEINGEFFRTKSIVSAVLINVFSEAENARDQVFDRYTVTTETPFEIPVPSDAAHTELAESLLGGDNPASAVLKDAAANRWSHPKQHKPRTMSGLQALFTLASPVFPLGGVSDTAEAFVSGLQKDLEGFSSAVDTRILHLRARTISEASLLTNSLVRHCIAKDSAPPSPTTSGKFVFNFEFRHGDVRFDNVRSMVATLLAQLFFNEIYPKYLMADRRLDIPAELRWWTTEDLLIMWKQRRFRKALNEAIYVLGGLDQCDIESVHYFLRWLWFVVTQTEMPIKIIITSTIGVDGHVKEALHSFPDGIYHSFDMRGGVSRSDSHLALLLQQQPRYDALKPKLRILMASIAESDDVLQVVAAWLKHTSLPLETVNATIDQLGQAGSLEASLDVILGLIPADRRVWSRRILSFACAAKRPLGVTEMYAISRLALTLPDDPSTATSGLVFKIPYLEDELKGILDWLGGLLTIRDGEFHLGNSSLPDALRPQIASHRIRQHKDILDICISYLSRPCCLNVSDDPLDDRRWSKTGSGSVDTLDPLPYAAEHWSLHYLILHASQESSSSTAEMRTQARQLLKEDSFLRHWEATQQAGSRPFAPLPKGTSPPGPLSVAAQLGLEHLVQEFLPGFSSEGHSGLVAAATNGHLGTVGLLLQRAGKYMGPDWASLVEAAKGAAACGHSDAFDLLVMELFLSHQPADKPPPSSLLFRAAFLGLDRVIEKLLDLGVDVNSAIDGSNLTPLHFAAMLDRVAALDVLLNHGGRVTAKSTPTGYHPVHTASYHGAVGCVKALLDANPSQSEAEASSDIPLVLAVEEGNFRVVEVLLKHDKHFGRPAGDLAVGYGKALHQAARFGYRRGAGLLLHCGADPNQTRFQGWTGLQWAAWNRRADICRLLLEKKADANDSGDIPAPLVISVLKGDAAIVTLLLEHGALVDDMDPGNGQTALHMASADGKVEIIRILLKNGTIDARDKTSYTPLFLAAMHKRAEAVDVLAAAGADVDIVSGWHGWRPLHVAYDAPEVIRVLLKHGADVNKACDDGTPLRIAAFYKAAEAAGLMLEKGARLKLAGEERESPLITAVLVGCTKTARALLEAGVDVSQIGRAGDAMSRVMGKSGTEMLELLLEFSPNPSLRESNTFLTVIGSDTPVRSVERLIHAGADPNREGDGGHTALCAAIMSSNVDVARYLLGLKSVRRHGIKTHDWAWSGLLHHALRCSTVEMVRLLVEAGEDVDASSEVTGGIVASACYHRDDVSDKKKLETLRYLIRDVKADVNARGGVVGHAINLAASSCGPDVIRLLLDQGAEQDVEDLQGRRTVHLACQNDLPVLQALSVPDESFRKPDRLGRLPLHFAAVSGRVALVREVLERSRRVGIGVDERDVHGWTALMWAARVAVSWPYKSPYPSEDDHEAVVKFLLDEGADRAASGQAEGGTWTPAEIATFHGAAAGLVGLLSPGRDQGGGTDKGKRLVGVEDNDTFCDCCLMITWGYYYRCETSEVVDLCFKCYQSREELAGEVEWVRRGEERKVESEEDVAVHSPDIDDDGNSAGEEDDEEIEDVIIEEE